MHRALSSRWLNSALNIAEQPARVELPLFLCPSISLPSHRRGLSTVTSSSRARASRWRPQTRSLYIESYPPAKTFPDPSKSVHQGLPLHKLPRQCRGCGALSQTEAPNRPGYFDLGRKAVRTFLGAGTETDRSRQEDKIYEDALKNLDHEELEKQGVDVQALTMSLGPVTETGHQPAPKPPLCDRCHYLMHNHTGESIYHPTMDAIRDTVLESPYKYNHVYHVLDAADFPMSILPNITELLEASPLRSRNRRSRAGRFYRNKKTEVSFIITRSDLLAPKKEQVDRLFPYLQEVLRDALGRTGRDVRLGNMAVVSAKRGWWTKELKEDIWERGGAGWMVGKVNVGKSQLFETVFPKGRMDWTPSKHQIAIDMRANNPNKGETASTEEDLEVGTKVPPDAEEEAAEARRLDMLLKEKLGDDSFLPDEVYLLPRAPKEVNYPEMPLVSDLPGTTASPIRVPFGNGRGELIDLPGLERTGLEKYVKPEHRLSLIMRSRMVPTQMTLKPSQSLLLGGFIRITPREPAPIMLTYAFTPITPHVSRTDKAIAIQGQTGEVNIDNIAVEGTGAKTKFAGSFELRWDVTKQRSGPLTRRDSIGLSVDRLPYRVLATDILIEGVGWVEIVAQVRTRDLYGPNPIAPPPEENPLSQPQDKQPQRALSALERLEAIGRDSRKDTSRRAARSLQLLAERKHAVDDGEPNWPVVDVYSPEGKFIAARRPMNGWLLNKPKVTAASTRSRPRKSMKGVKKLEKRRRREQEQKQSTPQPGWNPFAGSSWGGEW